MPIFVVPLLALALGGAGALLVESSGSERRRYTVMRERASTLVWMVALLILAPNAAYFACRWPDWSVAYLFRASKLPSAIALLAAVGAAAPAGAAFHAGLVLVRDERRRALVIGVGALLGVAALVAALLGPRLWLAGTFDDFKHPEEMKTLSGSWLGLAVVTMNALTLIGAWVGLSFSPEPGRLASTSPQRVAGSHGPGRADGSRVDATSPLARRAARGAMPKLRGNDLQRR